MGDHSQRLSFVDRPIHVSQSQC